MTSRIWADGPTGNTPLTAAMMNGIEADLDARVQAWKAGATYAASQPVVNPSGDLVTRISAGSDGASYVAANWKPSPTYARIVALPNSNGTDDTSALNSLFAANQGGRFRGATGQTYIITAPLIIPTGAELDMRGCTISAAGTGYRMLQNASYGSTTTRDSGITIIGGTWAAGSVDGNTHRIVMNRVDRLKIADVTVTSTSGKYAILLADVTDFRVEKINLTAYSDGIHVTGPAKDGVISQIYGTSGDDFVALGCSDYTTYDISRGDIKRIEICDIYPQNTTGGGRSVALFTVGASGVTDTMEMTSITIRNVKGTINATGVHVSDDLTGNTQYKNILIEDISILTPAGFAQVLINSKNPVRELAVKDIVIPYNTPANVYGVYIQGGVTFPRIAVDRIACAATVQITGVYVEAGTTVARLQVRGVDLTGGSSWNTATVKVGGTVTLLQVSDSFINGTMLGINTSGSAGTVTDLMLNNCANTSGGNMVTHQGATAMNIHYADILTVSGNTFSIEGASGCTAVINGGGYAQNSGRGVNRTSSQPVRARSLDFACDVSYLTKTAGDMAYNTNGALSCGTGAAVCDGTNWKNLFSGAVY